MLPIVSGSHAFPVQGKHHYLAVTFQVVEQQGVSHPEDFRYISP